MAKATKRRGREFWSEMVTEFERVGGSQTAFARERGLATTSFQRWLRRLRAEARPMRFVELAAAVEPPPSTLVRVRLGDVILEFDALPPVEYVAALCGQLGGRC